VAAVAILAITKTCTLPGVVMYAYNPSTREAEKRGSRAVEASFGQIVRYYLKHKTKLTKTAHTTAYITLQSGHNQTY
jgi:hypothetical protein